MKEKFIKLILLCLKKIAINSAECASVFGMGQPVEPKILNEYCKRGKYLK